MKTHLKFFFSALMTVLCAACEPKESGNPAEPEDTNGFNYIGYDFHIGSVVRYDEGNTIQFWCSPTEGYTSAAEIAASADPLVICVHKTILRSGLDDFSQSGSYIRFGNKIFRAKTAGHSGLANVRLELNEEERKIKLTFRAQKLYSRANAPESMDISGKYEGTYHLHPSIELDNQWALGFNTESIAKTEYITEEGKGGGTLITYDEHDREGIRLSVPSGQLSGTYTNANIPAGMELTYGNGIKFNFNGFEGTFSINISREDKTVSFAMDLRESDSDERLRAVYNGRYNDILHKSNRYIFTYQGTRSHTCEHIIEGSCSHPIIELFVGKNSGMLTLFFAPSDRFSSVGASTIHMPILTIPESIINTGRKAFTDEIISTTDWEFGFDAMQVWSFTDEYRPHPTADSWITISKDDNGQYEIEMFLEGQATGSADASIDLYYSGPASN